MSPLTEVHAPHHIHFCLPGHPRNSQGEDGCICPSFAVPRRAKQPAKEGPASLLAESIAKLRREVGFYLSFMDEEVFQGVDLPKE